MKRSIVVMTNQRSAQRYRKFGREVQYCIRHWTMIPSSACKSALLTGVKRMLATRSGEVDHRPHDEDILTQTRHLLDPSHKLDATDPQLWQEIEKVLQGWLQLEHELSSTDPVAEVHPLRRVEWSLRLLDRLAASLPKGEILFASLLDTQILHRLLKVWKYGLQMDFKDDTSIQRLRRTLSPSVLAEKMDKYRWVSLMQPDAHSFNILLHASTLIPSYREGVGFADGLLRRLIEVVSQENSDNGEAPVFMDEVSISTVMQAWVQHGQPEKAEAWLDQLQLWQNEQANTYLGHLRPNHVMYTTVLSGWAKLRNAERALAILERQIDDFQHGNQSAKPDAMSFNCVLDALAKSENHTAVTQAETILTQMKEYSSSLGWRCSPDDHTWNNLLACYARHKPKKAERLFKQWETGGLNLTLLTYNIMLQGYARRGRVEEALDLLERLEESSSHDLEPDETFYNIVLSTFAKSKAEDAPVQAEAMLDRMRRQGIVPTTISYSTLLQCWAKSNHTRAAERAEEWLQEMKQYPESQPNIICYNIVLNAWGKQTQCANNQKAMERVLRLFYELVDRSNNAPMETALRPTDSTFRAVLHAIATSQVSKKADLVTAIEPIMKRYGFRPNERDEKLLHRLTKSSGRSNKTSS